MRQTLRSSTSAQRDATPLVGDIAELRAELTVRQEDPPIAETTVTQEEVVVDAPPAEGREAAEALTALDFPSYAVGGVSVGEPEPEMLKQV